MNEVSPKLVSRMYGGGNSVDSKCHKIIALIQDFQNELDENTELTIKFASYGEDIQMSPQFITWQ